MVAKGCCHVGALPLDGMQRKQRQRLRWCVPAATATLAVHLLTNEDAQRSAVAPYVAVGRCVRQERWRSGSADACVRFHTPLHKLPHRFGGVLLVVASKVFVPVAAVRR